MFVSDVPAAVRDERKKFLIIPIFFDLFIQEILRLLIEAESFRTNSAAGTGDNNYASQ